MSRASPVDPLDLTGLWHGRYGYDWPMEPVGFVATLLELSGVVTGVTAEQHRINAIIPTTIPAVISGERQATAVSFLKTYDGTLGFEHTVTYAGAINAEGTEIEGRWSIPGDWAGWFLMIRTEPL